MMKPKIMFLITITILGLSIGYGAFNAELSISGEATVNSQIYKEVILNGTEPKLEEPLIPVTIEDDGTVKKADITSKWYSYEEKRWANAVILKNESKTYYSGEIIPEEEIESYFVWIPKYSYKLWDLGNYSSTTTIDESKVHSIEIRFGTINTSDSVSGECTTPGISGESGNCEVGNYMTHPAFLAFNTTGLWVGKFETGYSGATSSSEASKNTTEVDKVIVKPNVYSWIGIQVANAFTVSYNYKRELESHMMKNTEWGAVAYLSHSVYGINDEIRINNNSSMKTGYSAVSEPIMDYPEHDNFGTDNSITQPYNTTVGYLASTTGNIIGIYDMSGGTWEYVMGVMKDANGNLMSGASFYANSGFNGTLKDGSSYTDGIDFPDSKYYDAYKYDSIDNSHSRRILGDATGEMGPFGIVKTTGTASECGDTGICSRAISSWYNDNSWFIYHLQPWFWRGGRDHNGTGSGIFSISSSTGNINRESFRLTLAF